MIVGLNGDGVTAGPAADDVSSPEPSPNKVSSGDCTGADDVIVCLNGDGVTAGPIAAAGAGAAGDCTGGAGAGTAGAGAVAGTAGAGTAGAAAVTGGTVVASGTVGARGAATGKFIP